MHLKELNVKVSEWVYFLNWDERFLKYSVFSAPKAGVIFARIAKAWSLCTWIDTKKMFLRLLVINQLNFAKYRPRFESKALNYAEYFGAIYDKLFST